MIPGKEVEIGGTKYMLPPLNIASLRKHREFLDKAAGYADGTSAPKVSDILEMSDIIFESLVRNYPQAKLDEIEEHLDTNKIVEAFTAVVAAGGAGPQTGESKPASP